MKLETFLRKLSHTERHWEVRYGSYIRCTGKKGFSMCPLSALSELPSGDWDKAADRFHLEAKIAISIVDAADARGNYDHSLRARLLSACGLKA